jgi:hypothetical protein
MNVTDLPPILASKIEVVDGGCWRWTAYVDVQGYGRVNYLQKTGTAHRLIYRLLRGDVPEGLTLDHICHNADPCGKVRRHCLHRRCVRPDHLDPVPIAVNNQRGRDARKTIGGAA